VACSDARPPAYEAAAGLAAAGLLDSLVTAYYHDSEGRLDTLLRHLPRGAAWVRRLARRNHPGIPATAVAARASVDLCLAVENRLRSGRLRRFVARTRTRRFDRAVAGHLNRTRPDVVFLFSDVGSVATLDRCRGLGIPSILSVVHGDIDEERALIDRLRVESPAFFPLYLGDGQLDERELDWLHDRRRREAHLADRLLVPSDHIARRLRERGIAAERIRVVPYAADPERFRPRPRQPESGSCVFVFAGGITQRKGISYLLEAWSVARREGWRLRLVGELPRRLGPLAGWLKQPGVELVGRVGHAQMPDLLADADVFVFPSLFEGSAVVTYEALACGLPLIVTSEAGSVARDGVEGLVVPAANVEALAVALRRLGDDPALRQKLARAARRRAESFTWSRYHSEVVASIMSLVGR
jgi:glycosyltransferase involved in cell wall biosynthesis